MSYENPITIEFATLESLQRCAKLLNQIIVASETKNCGVTMGEAVVCRYWMSEADDLLRQAGVRK